MRYATRYVHKVHPKESDKGPSVTLETSDLRTPADLGAALRRQKVLVKGGRVRDFRTENGGRIVAFPSAPNTTTYWHAIVLTPVT